MVLHAIIDHASSISEPMVPYDHCAALGSYGSLLCSNLSAGVLVNSLHNTTNIQGCPCRDWHSPVSTGTASIAHASMCHAVLMLLCQLQNRMI
jgi:hypothetical protein